MARRKKGGSSITKGTKKNNAEKTNHVASMVGVRHELVEVDKIQQERSLQMRVKLDDNIVKEYAERMKLARSGRVQDKEGVDFEPIELVENDNGTLYLVDGWHRLEAARKKKFEKFQARVKGGDRQRALELSLIANARHGLRRTNSDKRRAVQTALANDEWINLSNGVIAEKCGVSVRFVSKLRNELVAKGVIEEVTTVVGRDGREIEVAQIGTNQPKTRNDAESAAIESTPIAAPLPGAVKKRVDGDVVVVSNMSDDIESGDNATAENTREAPESSQHDKKAGASHSGTNVIHWPEPGYGGWKRIAAAYSAGDISITPLPSPQELVRCMGLMVSAQALARGYVDTPDGTLIVWSMLPLDDLPLEVADGYTLKEIIEEQLSAGGDR